MSEQQPNDQLDQYKRRMGREQTIGERLAFKLIDELRARHGDQKVEMWRDVMGAAMILAIQGDALEKWITKNAEPTKEG